MNDESRSKLPRSKSEHSKKSSSSKLLRSKSEHSTKSSSSKRKKKRSTDADGAIAIEEPSSLLTMATSAVKKVKKQPPAVVEQEDEPLPATSATITTTTTTTTTSKSLTKKGSKKLKTSEKSTLKDPPIVTPTNATTETTATKPMQQKTKPPKASKAKKLPQKRSKTVRGGRRPSAIISDNEAHDLREISTDDDIRSAESDDGDSVVSSVIDFSEDVQSVEPIEGFYLRDAAQEKTGTSAVKPLPKIFTGMEIDTSGGEQNDMEEDDDDLDNQSVDSTDRFIAQNKVDDVSGQLFWGTAPGQEVKGVMGQEADRYDYIDVIPGQAQSKPTKAKKLPKKRSKTVRGGRRNSCMSNEVNEFFASKKAAESQSCDDQSVDSNNDVDSVVSSVIDFSTDVESVEPIKGFYITDAQEDRGPVVKKWSKIFTGMEIDTSCHNKLDDDGDYDDDDLDNQSVDSTDRFIAEQANAPWKDAEKSMNIFYGPPPGEELESKRRYDSTAVVPGQSSERNTGGDMNSSDGDMESVVSDLNDLNDSQSVFSVERYYLADAVERKVVKPTGPVRAVVAGIVPGIVPEDGEEESVVVEDEDVDDEQSTASTLERRSQIDEQLFWGPAPGHILDDVNESSLDTMDISFSSGKDDENNDSESIIDYTKDLSPLRGNSFLEREKEDRDSRNLSISNIVQRKQEEQKSPRFSTSPRGPVDLGSDEDDRHGPRRMSIDERIFWGDEPEENAVKVEKKLRKKLINKDAMGADNDMALGRPSASYIAPVPREDRRGSIRRGSFFGLGPPLDDGYGGAPQTPKMHKQMRDGAFMSPLGVPLDIEKTPTTNPKRRGSFFGLGAPINESPQKTQQRASGGHFRTREDDEIGGNRRGSMFGGLFGPSEDEVKQDALMLGVSDPDAVHDSRPEKRRGSFFGALLGSSQQNDSIGAPVSPQKRPFPMSPQKKSALLSPQKRVMEGFGNTPVQEKRRGSMLGDLMTWSRSTNEGHDEEDDEELGEEAYFTNSSDDGQEELDGIFNSNTQKRRKSFFGDLLNVLAPVQEEKKTKKKKSSKSKKKSSKDKSKKHKKSKHKSSSKSESDDSMDLEDIELGVFGEEKRKSKKKSKKKSRLKKFRESVTGKSALPEEDVEVDTTKGLGDTNSYFGDDDSNDSDAAKESFHDEHDEVEPLTGGKRVLTLRIIIDNVCVRNSICICISLTLMLVIAAVLFFVVLSPADDGAEPFVMPPRGQPTEAPTKAPPAFIEEPTVIYDASGQSINDHNHVSFHFVQWGFFLGDCGAHAKAKIELTCESGNSTNEVFIDLLDEKSLNGVDCYHSMRNQMICSPANMSTTLFDATFMVGCASTLYGQFYSSSAPVMTFSASALSLRGKECGRYNPVRYIGEITTGMSAGHLSFPDGTADYYSPLAFHRTPANTCDGQTISVNSNSVCAQLGDCTDIGPCEVATPEVSVQGDLFDEHSFLSRGTEHFEWNSTAMWNLVETELNAPNYASEIHSDLSIYGDLPR